MNEQTQSQAAPAETVNAPAAEGVPEGQSPLPAVTNDAAGDTSSEYSALMEKGNSNPEYKYTDAELDRIEALQKAGNKPWDVKPIQAKPEAQAQTANAPTPTAPTADPKTLEALGFKTVEDAQNIRKSFETLEKQTRNQIALFEDLRAGKPEAMAYFEKNFGGKFVPNGQQQAAPAEAQQAADAGLSLELPKEMFISDEAHAQANAALGKVTSEIKTIRDEMKGYKNAQDNLARTEAQVKAKAEVTDSLVKIADKLGGFDKASIRSEIAEWMDGKENPKMAAFDEIFALANKHKTDLDAAFLIRQGMKASEQVIEAEKRGREQAYGHKPTPPLSQAQGKGNQVYSPLSDKDAQDYADGVKAMPDDWFNAKGDPIRAKIPAKMHKHFGWKD